MEGERGREYDVKDESEGEVVGERRRGEAREEVEPVAPVPWGTTGRIW